MSTKFCHFEKARFPSNQFKGVLHEPPGEPAHDSRDRNGSGGISIPDGTRSPRGIAVPEEE